MKSQFLVSPLFAARSELSAGESRGPSERGSVRPPPSPSNTPASEGDESAATTVAPSSIVVAIDASEGASRVITSATRVVREMPSAMLHVVHVFRTSRFDRHAGVPGAPAEAIEEAKEHLESHARAARRQCRAQVRSHFAVGSPVTEVLRLCSDLKADLLVIGTHDRDGFERLLLGSNAAEFARKARCSLLVVRPSTRSADRAQS